MYFGDNDNTPGFLDKNIKPTGKENSTQDAFDPASALREKISVPRGGAKAPSNWVDPHFKTTTSAEKPAPEFSQIKAHYVFTRKTAELAQTKKDIAKLQKELKIEQNYLAIIKKLEVLPKSDVDTFINWLKGNSEKINLLAKKKKLRKEITTKQEIKSLITIDNNYWKSVDALRKNGVALPAQHISQIRPVADVVRITSEGGEIPVFKGESPAQKPVKLQTMGDASDPANVNNETADLPKFVKGLPSEDDHKKGRKRLYKSYLKAFTADREAAATMGVNWNKERVEDTLSNLSQQIETTKKDWGDLIKKSQDFKVYMLLHQFIEVIGDKNIDIHNNLLQQLMQAFNKPKQLGDDLPSETDSESSVVEINAEVQALDKFNDSLQVSLDKISQENAVISAQAPALQPKEIQINYVIAQSTNATKQNWIPWFLGALVVIYILKRGI